MREEEPGLGGALGPLAARRPFVPSEAAAASHRLEGAGMEATRYRGTPACAIDLPPLTHHALILFTRSPDELELRSEGVKRHVPPPAGSVLLWPAGGPVRVRSSGCKDALHMNLELGLVARVAAYAGFSDRSVFSHHFKRLVGVTPGQFRTSTRIA